VSHQSPPAIKTEASHNQQHKAEEEKDKAPSDLKVASSFRTSSYAPDLQNLKQLMPKLPSSISDQPADKNGETESYFSK
jgi:hypothetical protein